jgi:hypothetical protein
MAFWARFKAHEDIAVLGEIKLVGLPPPEATARDPAVVEV